MALDLRFIGRGYNSRPVCFDVTQVNSALQPPGSLNRVPADLQDCSDLSVSNRPSADVSGSLPSSLRRQHAPTPVVRHSDSRCPMFK